MSELDTQNSVSSPSASDLEEGYRLYEEGLRHEYGYGVPCDLSLAFRGYEGASQRGLGAGCYRLGRCYEYGLGVTRDLCQSLSCYRQGVESGDLSCLVSCGRFLLFGIGAERDVSQAEHYLREGASRGDGLSHRLLAEYVSGSDGGSLDLSAARSRYECGARAGDVFSQARLGLWCLYGIGGELSLSDGYRWCLAACQGGDIGSCSWVGLCCLEGLGTSVDLVAGSRWLERACSYGDEVSLVLSSSRGLPCGSLGGVLSLRAREQLLSLSVCRSEESCRQAVSEAVSACRAEGAASLAAWKSGESSRIAAAVAAERESCSRELADWKAGESSRVKDIISSCQKESEKALSAWKSGESQRIQLAVSQSKKESEDALSAWKSGEAARLKSALEACKKEASEDLEVWKLLEQDRIKSAVSEAVAVAKIEFDATLAAWKSGERERHRAAVEEAVSACRQEASEELELVKLEYEERLKKVSSSTPSDDTSSGLSSSASPSSSDSSTSAEPAVSSSASSSLSSSVSSESSSSAESSRSGVSSSSEQSEGSGVSSREEYAVLESSEALASPEGGSSGDVSSSSVSALSELAVSSSEGIGSPYCREGLLQKSSGDFPGAIASFEKGISLGDSGCLCALGECYERGEGCERNDERAASLYRQSADLGNPRAKLLIGRYEFTAPEDGDTVSEFDNFSVFGLGLKMIWCHRGVFQMGSPKGWFGGATERGRNDNETRHQVTLSMGYWLGKYPVTQEEFSQLAESCGLQSHPSQFRGGTLPVENVSWEDAQIWCEALTKRERSQGRLPDHYAYRLPTEAEWEYACRAGSTAAFHDGLNMQRDDGVCESLQKLGWFRDNSNELTHDVGLLNGNGWGFFDMHGNVSEWCYDKYEEYHPGAVTDPLSGFSGRRGDTGLRRVRRGGSWQDSARDCRCASRSQGSVNFRRPFIGFRVALGRELPGWRS